MVKKEEFHELLNTTSLHVHVSPAGGFVPPSRSRRPTAPGTGARNTAPAARAPLTQVRQRSGRRTADPRRPRLPIRAYARRRRTRRWSMPRPRAPDRGRDPRPTGNRPAGSGLGLVLVLLRSAIIVRRGGRGSVLAL